MQSQPILKDKEINEITAEVKQILDLLDKIETHTIELRKKLMAELNKKS